MPSVEPGATQRLERFAFAFGFEREAAFDAFFAAGLALGFAGAAAGFAALAAGTAAAGTCLGAAAGGVIPPVRTIGLAGVRELDVFSGGSGCLRGRPLLRAAWPSAMSLSNAALASASRRACCELRDVVARSFSARKRSSGRVCFMRKSR